MVTPSEHETAASRPGSSATVPATQSKMLNVGVVIALVVLSVAVMVASSGLGYWTELGPGPGFFPFWISLILAMSSLVWGVQSLRGGRAEPVGEEVQPEHSVASSTDGTTLPTKKRPIWVVVLSLVVLTSLLEVLGYQLAMFSFLLFQLRILGGHKWLSSLAIAAAGSVGVFILFTQFLQVPLPTSSFGFLENLGL